MDHVQLSYMELPEIWQTEWKKKIFIQQIHEKKTL